ncbi:MAG: Rieske 2Fe-2S domain-containing protein [Acidobacteria bacterium]|nr:Rieske 2Fe-2S domain-containing protein [Acidobacteriota bacterium]
MSFTDFDFDERLANAATLPADLYCNDAVFAHETRRIFQRTWQLAGRLEQLPTSGSYFTFELHGEPLVIVRGKDEIIRGFFNVCRHRAGPVAGGAGCRPSLQCAYHGWNYALDGRLLATPAFEGVADFDKNDHSLVSVSVAVWESFIFVNLDPTSTPLTDVLEDIPALTAPFNLANLKFVERRDYLLDCNWKVYVDNFLEGYHLPMVHPGLMRELDFSKYRTLTRRYYSLQDAPIRPASPKDDQRYYQSDAHNEALYFWVFPNLMININPATLSTNLIVPLSAEKTLTIFEWFTPEQELATASERLQATIEFSDEIQQEDIAICEAVQRGLRSQSYDRGRYAVRFENGLHHFHQLWREFCVTE